MEKRRDNITNADNGQKWSK